MDFKAEELFQQGKKFLLKNRYDLAIERFSELTKIKPNFPDVQNFLGLAYAYDGQNEEAAGHFRRAVELNTNYVEAFLNLAITCNEIGRYGEALDAFEKAAKTEDTDKDVKGFTPAIHSKLTDMHSALGDIYAGIGSNVEAVLEYQKALKLNPEFVDIRNKLGRVYIALKLYDNAEREFLEVKRRNPEYLDASVNLGLCYYYSGNLEQAREEWEKCLQLDPENSKVKVYFKILEEGEGLYRDESQSI